MMWCVWIYDALYRMNVECDFVWPESEDLSQYKAIFVPALYAAPDSTLERLNQYVKDGWHVGRDILKAVLPMRM